MDQSLPAKDHADPAAQRAVELRQRQPLPRQPPVARPQPHASHPASCLRLLHPRWWHASPRP
eukprot:4539538-Alexandrium_andersonii.AAC.1